MRIRQVRPEFWTDETLAVLPDSVRLFYIGLWNVADDAGWIEWQPRRIGALLYPYRTARRRERDVETWAQLLIDDGRLQVYACGCGHIPTLPRHQRIGGNRAYPVRDEHLNKHRLDTESIQVRTSPPVTLSNVRLGNVTREADESFKEKLAKAGFKES